MFAPLIHISSSDDEDDFHPDCVPSSSRPPCPPIPDHSPLPTLNPEDDPEEDPEEDPDDDQDYDLYWVSDDDGTAKHD